MGSGHVFKYRLALVVEGHGVLRCDHERGKGDHRAVPGEEHPYISRIPGLCSTVFGMTWTIGGSKMRTVTLAISPREKVNNRLLRAFDGEAQGAIISLSLPRCFSRCSPASAGNCSN